MSSLLERFHVNIDNDALNASLIKLQSCNTNAMGLVVIKELLKLVETPDLMTKYLSSESMVSFVWERLNTGHWSEVSLVWRKLFTVASLIKIQSVIQLLKDDYSDFDAVLEDLIKMCDVALMMGAPVSGLNVETTFGQNVASTSGQNVVAELATKLSEYLREKSPLKFEEAEVSEEPKPKKLKVDFSSLLGRFRNVHQVPIEDNLSVEDFCQNFRKSGNPVVVRGALDGWPALEEGGKNQWSVEYLKKVAGYRTVPIELGRRYTDDSWTQSLMTIRRFVDDFLIDNRKGVGYLAQHELFEQIPELRQDFDIPEFCYTGSEDDEDVHTNCWIGPEGTVSPLHTDPKHNCLAQVVGTKHVVLFPESQTSFLAAFEEGILTNTSQIDLEQNESEILKKFPDFGSAKGFECILMPGDILYIPPSCWHFVKSLSTSFSVSFWFK